MEIFMNQLQTIKTQTICLYNVTENQNTDFTDCTSQLMPLKREKLEKILNPPTKNQPALEQAKRIQNCFKYFLLEIAQEATQAIINAEYTKFDALVGNFGCHLTASFVQDAVRQNPLRNEAEKIEQVIGQLLEKIAKNASIEPQDLNFTFSQEMYTLIRLRLLCLVNTSILNDKSKEVPITNSSHVLDKITNKIAPLFIPTKHVKTEKLKNISSNMIESLFGRKKKDFKEDEVAGVENTIAILSSKLEQNGIEFQKMLNAVSLLVNGLQEEESEKAAQYVRELSLNLNPSNERTALVQRMLQKEFERNESRIVSLPLMYNTEAVINSYKGIVLVKNKLLLCGQLREGMKERKIFIQWPENRLLSPEEIKSLSDDEPLLVFEGDLSSELPVEELIIQKGLCNVINAVNAQPQYEKYHSKLDEEGMNDLKIFADRKEDAAVFDDLDHIYCASVKEERKSL